MEGCSVIAELMQGRLWKRRGRLSVSVFPNFPFSLWWALGVLSIGVSFLWHVGREAVSSVSAVSQPWDGQVQQKLSGQQGPIHDLAIVAFCLGELWVCACAGWKSPSFVPPVYARWPWMTKCGIKLLPLV